MINKYLKTTVPLIVVMFSLAISGCVYINEYKGPDSDTAPEFSQVKRLEAIEGKYRNAGEPEGYFSVVLWGEYKEDENQTLDSALDYFTVNGKKVFHKDIDTIEIKLANVSGLKVTARDRNGKKVKSQTYYLGKDFKIIEEKKVPVRDEMMLFAGSDDPMLGPKGESVELGLNREGDVVCRTKSWAYGVVYSILPVGGSVTTDWIFHRLPEK